MALDKFKMELTNYFFKSMWAILKTYNRISILWGLLRYFQMAIVMTIVSFITTHTPHLLLVTCVLIPPLGRRSLSALKTGRSGVQDPSSVDVQMRS